MELFQNVNQNNKIKGLLGWAGWLAELGVNRAGCAGWLAELAGLGGTWTASGFAQLTGWPGRAWQSWAG